ncbi:hypothetical protein BDM02DRAFT_1314263 [Thelephora ganbajun]|uniref:Uncharacterized protein n=1 Tax=Thelephora ganbajun TaxID=370292 RepID=A0ACB6Z3I0_THEGA|nr:hypothetical protein BDM02DRAFT_1314263 [Thelephora ganbajun]
MANIRLPTARKLPDDSGQERLCSIVHSRVVLQSLRQSHERWFNALPKFSSKSRSTKNPGVTPPPHSPETLGHCDIYIGPHVFYQTALYKIDYYPPTQQASTYYTTQPPQTTLGSSTSYGATSYGTTPYYQSATQPQESSNPLIAITPELLTRVTTAGTTNPTLANLLRLAASKQATQEELKRLGALIQSLAAVPQEIFPAQPLSQHIPTTSIKPPDLVVEFQERGGTQFLLPRGPSLCERVESPSGDGGHDIMLTTCLRVPKATAPVSSDARASTEETEDVITFRFAKASEEFWSFLLLWVGDSTEKNQKIIERKVINVHPVNRLGTDPG